MRRIRVLVAKVGLDGHEVGARVVARGLADVGIEVVYTGLRRTPEQVVQAALQEDVDVIGVSSLSGAHLPLLLKVKQLMTQAGMDDVLLIAGGIIPDDDANRLKAAGIDEVFHPGTTVPEIADYIRRNVREEYPDAVPTAGAKEGDSDA